MNLAGQFLFPSSGTPGEGFSLNNYIADSKKHLSKKLPDRCVKWKAGQKTAAKILKERRQKDIIVEKRNGGTER